LQQYNKQVNVAKHKEYESTDTKLYSFRLTHFKKRVKEVTFLKCDKFFLMEIKYNETEVVEEYLWVITQANTCAMLQPISFQCVGL